MEAPQSLEALVDCSPLPGPIPVPGGYPTGLYAQNCLLVIWQTFPTCGRWHPGHGRSGATNTPLFTTAVPGCVPTGLETRKVASSVNYFTCMVFEDICHYTGWKSQQVFHRHYLKNIKESLFPTVAAGTVVMPK